eukprot:362436-Chlamydomonas_euryale.AAC.2
MEVAKGPVPAAEAPTDDANGKGGVGQQPAKKGIKSLSSQQRREDEESRERRGRREEDRGRTEEHRKQQRKRGRRGQKVKDQSPHVPLCPVLSDKSTPSLKPRPPPLLRSDQSLRPRRRPGPAGPQQAPACGTHAKQGVRSEEALGGANV